MQKAIAAKKTFAQGNFVFLKLAALRAARAPPRDPVPGQLPSWVDPWVMGNLYHPPNQFSYAPAKKVTFTNQDL